MIKFCSSLYKKYTVIRQMYRNSLLGKEQKKDIFQLVYVFEILALYFDSHFA